MGGFDEGYLKDNSWAAWREAYKRADARRIRKSATRGLLHWTGHKLDDLPLPLSPLRTIDALFADIDGYVYVAGDEGVVAYGHHMTGFKPFNVIGLQDRVLSIVNFQDAIYVSTSRCVFEVNSHRSEFVSLPFAGTHPLKLATSANYLFYFDRRAKVACFDGKEWTEVAIPAALLDREFHHP